MYYRGTSISTCFDVLDSAKYVWNLLVLLWEEAISFGTIIPSYFANRVLPSFLKIRGKGHPTVTKINSKLECCTAIFMIYFVRKYVLLLL